MFFPWWVSCRQGDLNDLNGYCRCLVPLPAWDGPRLLAMVVVPAGTLALSA
jgi:hypothetical protein